MNYGPDTHPSPLWNHPDHEHVGWAFVPSRYYIGEKDSTVGVLPQIKSNEEVRSHIEEWGPRETNWAPVFKSPTGHVVVHRTNLGETNFYHYPHDRNLAPTLWSALHRHLPWRTHGNTALNVLSPTKIGSSWSISNTSNRSSPAIIKGMMRTIRDHFPGAEIEGSRATGWHKGTNKSHRVFFTKELNKLAAEDVERYYNEVYDGLWS